MRSVVSIVAVVSFLTLTSISLAQYKTGEWDFSIGGSGANNKDFNAGNFNVAANIGYLVTDRLEVALRQSVGYSDFNNGTFWTGASRLAVDYHIGDSKLLPFIGVNLGYLYGDGVTNTMEAAPEIGLKYFANPTTYIYGLMEYQFFFRNSDQADNAFHDGQFVYSLGVGFKL